MSRLVRVRQQFLHNENKQYTRTLESVPPPYPSQGEKIQVIGVWRSSEYLVQMVRELTNNAVRLTVCRSMVDNEGQWVGGITWDELMRLKREVGHGDTLALECYPRDKDIVTVANMRHIWLMPEGTQFGWVNN